HFSLTLSIVCSSATLLSVFFFSCSGAHRDLHSFPTRRSSDLIRYSLSQTIESWSRWFVGSSRIIVDAWENRMRASSTRRLWPPRSEEHTSELQSRFDLVCRLLLEKKKKKDKIQRLNQDTLDVS